MDRIQKSLILLLVIGVPAGAQTFFAGPSGACFVSGSATYRIDATASAPDFRVRIDNKAARPDMRVRLVDDAATADFILVDDIDMPHGDVCKHAANLKTIKVDASDNAADLTISLSSRPAESDYKIYVHSARFSPQDAAALLAVMTRGKRAVAARD